jgi:hypothetical protein
MELFAGTVSLKLRVGKSGLIRHFTFDVAGQRGGWKSMAVRLVIRYQDVNGMVLPLPLWKLLEFKAAIYAGPIGAINVKYNLVYYGGVYDEDGKIPKALEGS